MSITRRNALVTFAGCGVTAAVAGVDDKPGYDVSKRDPVYSSVPATVRQVFEETFPQHRCVRMVIHDRGKETAVYRGTVFNPADVWSTSVRLVNGESVVTPILDEMEVDAQGKVLEEPLRLFNPQRLPRAVVAAYQTWNPKRVKGQEQIWQTEVARGKDRIYRVKINVNAVKSYSATFKEDGTVLEANPPVER
ncbi:MAG: hypothetical protein QM703_26760 [Gemmatales bacterium]